MTDNSVPVSSKKDLCLLSTSVVPDFLVPGKGGAENYERFFSRVSRIRNPDFRIPFAALLGGYAAQWGLDYDLLIPSMINGPYLLGRIEDGTVKLRSGSPYYFLSGKPLEEVLAPVVKGDFRFPGRMSGRTVPPPNTIVEFVEPNLTEDDLLARPFYGGLDERLAVLLPGYTVRRAVMDDPRRE